jgi:DNA transposition AAA+ family ATPase
VPVTAEVKERLEQLLPSADVTRARLIAYMERADLSKEAMAMLIGRSRSGLQHFLNGTYTTAKHGAVSTDLVIRRDLEAYMAANPLDAENAGEGGGRFYETENTAIIRSFFEFCYGRRKMALLYGAPGSQKTHALRHLVIELNRRETAAGTRNRAYRVYVSQGISPRDLLRRICEQASVPVGGSVQACLSHLRHAFRGRQIVLVLDEAQHASLEVLHTVRELNDEDPNAGILIAGSHSIAQMLDQHAIKLEQLDSRIKRRAELPGVSDACARAIFAAECPWLDADKVARFIDGSRVPDPYKKGATYLSMRRIFDGVEEAHNHQRTTNPAESEVLQ